ncbi:hypothetical protein HRR83_001028 [Exophiala dermatitidis]|uniref:Uncharacterized protein n=2 Tax=Exophiala dermatitidis TaxID=5970 RepID=H6C7K2_EXODN|nr:uncharacterized protein HMPREF1120_07681 [Exophiala dermatitidis NIH/UT8656]KAJ4522544.1 hypothetical protein HRR75_000938 [Exophiala dermatitidis]EHY59698.1 hypothetical protein HMPREF1120_07681 [Exophiala dermatitidis NIH/UT8656]KAJ4525839.1 hypothetical protein HRR74_001032 [Exophiala dermatitidis]KAJ4527216.1 hypothetical protein HRR73_002013 [Exophiala dermatitidis]KAJ4532940.1 hypothetical protein HRR76_007914 [Exophiala dermatitidis]
MTVLREALSLSILYFLLVFMTGFLFGSIRVPFLEPAMGARLVEILEAPIMLLVIWQAAQLTVWQLEVAASTFFTPLLIGAFSLLWLGAVESSDWAIFESGWWNGFRVHIVHKDPLLGLMYVAVALTYLAMPWYVWARQKSEIDEALLEISAESKGYGDGDEYCSR